MNRILSVALMLGLPASGPLLAQPSYTGQTITGQLYLSGTVNLATKAGGLRIMGGVTDQMSGAPEKAPNITPVALRPPVGGGFGAQGAAIPSSQTSATMQSMPVSPSNIFGFLGPTHYDQRMANGGNQFSVEPPNPSVATANGFVLAGVNNAVQVYSTLGSPQLAMVLSSNEVFGVPAAIDRNTGINGVFPTDMRVFYDQSIDRWFILQRAQDYATDGNTMSSSHFYMAVSQTGDPTGTYNIYIMDTTNASHGGCPCFADYPQIGADQYGFYISTNEFNTSSNNFVDAQIWAISKASLAAGAAAPTMYRFILPNATGFEFAIQPAYTPPGASYYVANNGIEYFASSNSSFSVNSLLAVWAMSNTASLLTPGPSPQLARINTSTLTYYFPNVATQRSGPLAYGSTLSPPGLVANLDGGDSRVQSLSYAGGRLYLTLASKVVDELGNTLVGGAYFILSPTFRNGVLAAPVFRQGYLMVQSNHLLRPAIGVTAQGRGVIAMTLVGPSYFPSAAYVPIDVASTGSAVLLASSGVGPEDGFTGYPNAGFSLRGVARWGDYSATAVSPDSSIWMMTEFIPNAPRTTLANWGTFLARYIP